MGESKERTLNADFNHNLYLAKEMLKKVELSQDRQFAVLWMGKLAQCNRSIEEMQLRNDYMYYLVLNIGKGKLCEPFTVNPPMGPLPGISQYLPGGGCKEDGKSGDRFGWEDPDRAGGSKPKAPPFLYSQSPDGGAFLNAQPIPRKGAFCYLAVVTKAED